MRDRRSRTNAMRHRINPACRAISQRARRRQNERFWQQVLGLKMAIFRAGTVKPSYMSTQLLLGFGKTISHITKLWSMVSQLHPRIFHTFMHYCRLST
jgi:hypothetical protein